MTDYFALLDQPRQPWLDLEKLKEAFHAKTRQTHPDAQTDNSTEAAFTQINEAYQVLQDPKRRLHHLLSLEGQAPSTLGSVVPEAIAEMFSTVAMATQQAERLTQKATVATNPLSRSLLQSELLRVRREIETALERLLTLRLIADDELKAAGGVEYEDRLRILQGLYLRYSYLTRWIGQLEEKRNQLTL